MVSQATKEYLKNMYERDMSTDEIIIRRLDTMIDLTQEMLDVMRMFLENQISGLTKYDEMCDNVMCGHSLDFHDIGCQVSECSCEQFYRKDKQ